MPAKIRVPFVPYSISIERNQIRGKVVHKDYDKVFVIGFNKTGTTTMKIVLERFGFKLGQQKIASILLEDYYLNRFDRIINFVKTANAFQDNPFSKPNLYKVLDEHFPNSKFILTVRDSVEQWHKSRMTFLMKRLGGKPLTEENFAKLDTIYEGWSMDMKKFTGWKSGEPLINEKKECEAYIAHIKDVENYFRNRERDFLKINVSKKDDFQKLCNFLKVKTDLTDFPWVKKT